MAKRIRIISREYELKLQRWQVYNSVEMNYSLNKDGKPHAQFNYWFQEAMGWQEQNKEHREVSCVFV